MPFPFKVTSNPPQSVVAIEHELSRPNANTRIVLRSSAVAPVRLVDSEWSEGLAHSVEVRNRNGGDRKGRVLAVWEDRDGQRGEPLAICCWHLPTGNWPLALIDAGYAFGVQASDGRALVEGVLLQALADLARDTRLQDTQVTRPSDELHWAVAAPEGGAKLKERKDRARAIATRAMTEYGFEKLPPGERPDWFENGFCGRREL